MEVSEKLRESIERQKQIVANMSAEEKAEAEKRFQAERKERLKKENEQKEYDLRKSTLTTKAQAIAFVRGIELICSARYDNGASKTMQFVLTKLPASLFLVWLWHWVKNSNFKLPTPAMINFGIQQIIADLSTNENRISVIKTCEEEIFALLKEMGAR